MLARHDLVYLDQAGREEACRWAVQMNPALPARLLESWIVDGIEGIEIPGIVKRQEQVGSALLELGFSTNCYSGESRIRINTQVPASSVCRTTTPRQVVALLPNYQNTHKRETLLLLNAAAEKHGVCLGVFGSTALEMVTGLRYSSGRTDIDLTAYPQATCDLEGFYQEALLIEKRQEVALDIELILRETYGIKLKEYIGKPAEMLAKSMYSVQLLPIGEAQELFNQTVEHAAYLEKCRIAAL